MEDRNKIAFTVEADAEKVKAAVEKEIKQAKPEVKEIPFSVETKPERGKGRTNYEYYSKPKLSSKTWFVVLMLIVFFPVGIYFMWKNTNWNKVVKIVITGIFALACLGSVVGGDGSSTPATKTADEKTELPVIFESNEKINNFINLYNEKYANEEITADMVSIYNHHGKDHENQAKVAYKDCDITISDTISNLEICVQGDDKDNMRILFSEFVPLYEGNISAGRAEALYQDKIEKGDIDYDLGENAVDIYPQVYDGTVAFYELSGTPLDYYEATSTDKYSKARIELEDDIKAFAEEAETYAEIKLDPEFLDKYEFIRYESQGESGTVSVNSATYYESVSLLYKAKDGSGDGYWFEFFYDGWDYAPYLLTYIKDKNYEDGVQFEHLYNDKNRVEVTETDYYFD